MKRQYGIVIIFLILSQFISAQDVVVSASIDKNSYLIGDYIYLKIHAEAAPATKLFWPAPEEITDFEIISANPIDSANVNGRLNYNQVIVYSVYDSGRYTIPVIRMQYKKAEDEQFNSVFTDSITFIVHTLSVDTTASIKPVKGILSVTEKNYLWLYILIGVIVLAILGTGIYFAFFARKSIKTILPKAKPKSLYEATIEKLRNLNQKNLWQKGEIKKYYIELTDIIRSYMEIRFSMQALESTSDEILDQLKMRHIDIRLIDQIDFILRVADLAKFAKSNPLPDENTQAMSYAYQFVESTKPVEAPAEKS